MKQQETTDFHYITSLQHSETASPLKQLKLNLLLEKFNRIQLTEYCHTIGLPSDAEVLETGSFSVM